MIDPTAAFAIEAVAPDPIYYVDVASSQTITATGDTDQDVDRGSYKVIEPEPEKPDVANAPTAGVPDPGSAKAIAYAMLKDRGWGDAEYSCLVSLWNKESGWNVNAHNASSGAHGIPQALPGNKMASVGADWMTSAKTQITWGLGYISGRYGTPCGAWASSEARGWY